MPAPASTARSMAEAVEFTVVVVTTGLHWFIESRWPAAWHGSRPASIDLIRRRAEEIGIGRMRVSARPPSSGYAASTRGTPVRACAASARPATVGHAGPTSETECSSGFNEAAEARRVPGIRTLMATIHDVAQRAGVSAGTVSNVLNRPSYVSADTRQRVLDAIDELGFVPNESSRQFRAGAEAAPSAWWSPISATRSSSTSCSEPRRWRGSRAPPSWCATAPRTRSARSTTSTCWCSSASRAS